MPAFGMTSVQLLALAFMLAVIAGAAVLTLIMRMTHDPAGNLGQALTYRNYEPRPSKRDGLDSDGDGDGGD
jgi:hypothetical protein